MPFEDTWIDVLLKAIRGLKFDATTLAKESGVAQKKIVTLLEGTYEEATLLAIAPVLNLHPKALLALVTDTSKIEEPSLPKNFKCFTTLYHDMEVHSYLLWSEMNKRAIAFDTGTDLSFLLEQLARHNLKLDCIFLTHAHADHIAQLSELTRKTGAPAWMGRAESILGAYPLDLPFSYHLDAVITIEARSTPGHSPGGTTYFIQGLPTPIAVVGDALFARSVGGMAPAVYTRGLECIRKSILSLPASTILAPGHGPLTTVQEERTANPFLSSSLLSL